MMMPATDLVVLGCLLLATIAAPAIMLRKERTRWGVAESLFWAAALLGIVAMQTLEIHVPGTLVFSLVIVARSLMFVGLVLTSDDGSLEWNATRAGIASGVLYLLLVPHVLQWPIDGDEPYFLLVTESIIEDADLDLANQYRTLSSSETGRLDLQPQLGDPVGQEGELYSRHEPLLSILLIPGTLIGGLHGAVATIAVITAFLVFSLLRLAEESGYRGVARSLVWPAMACAPPVLFFATRLWAEVPGALAFSEAIRAMRAKRWKTFVFWLIALSLLQLRFGLIAAGLLIVAIVRERMRPGAVAIAVALFTIPFIALWIATGAFFGVHQTFELLPMAPSHYLRGFAGLLVDAQAGLLFQAPLWLLGGLAIIGKHDRRAVGVLWLAVVPYLLLLAPRGEWHGGWSPPLRYLVVLAPIVALSLAQVQAWLPRGVKILAAFWTVCVVIHGIAYPWRLFHIASGESVLGEAISSQYGRDASRLLPSLIRVDTAAVVWALVVAGAALLLARWHHRLNAAVVAIILCTGFGLTSLALRQPGRVVELEDAHVAREGGELFPERWTVARFRFRGGWSMPEGAAASFHLEPGGARIDYQSDDGAILEIDGRRWELPPTNGFESATVSIESAEVRMTVLKGSAVIDRIVREKN